MHEALLPPQPQRLPPIHHLPPRQPPPQSHQLPQFLPLRQTSTDEQVLDYGLYLIQQHLARETSIYMTLLQTCLKLWENGTQSRIITTSSSRDSLSLMQTTSKPSWTLQSITLTLDNKLLLMLSPMPIRILPRLSSCSSSMDQVELGRPLFTMPSLPRPDYRAIYCPLCCKLRHCIPTPSQWINCPLHVQDPHLMS